MTEDRNARRRARAAEKRRTDSRIRVGDRVRILDPKVFVRCGYPMGRIEALREIETQYEGELEAFLKKLGVHYDPTIKAHERLLHELAYVYQKARGFGGRKRTIHTDERPDLLGQECLVLGRKVVMTGTYYAPSGGYMSGWGEWDDYETGGLDGAETHVIFELVKYDSQVITRDKFWIESKHLEKVVLPATANQSAPIPF